MLKNWLPYHNTMAVAGAGVCSTSSDSRHASMSDSDDQKASDKFDYDIAKVSGIISLA
jgi:hypothetical protein